MMSKTLSLILLLLLPVLTLAHSHRDSVLSTRSRHFLRGQHVQKRSQGTFYPTGLGACGGTNSNSDFIVALNKEQFDQGGWCYKSITINYKGKTAQAQIVDRCEGCGWGNIDLSPGLFSFLSGAPLSDILNIGVLQLDWHVNGGGGNDNQPPPLKPTPKTTTTQSTTHKATLQPTVTHTSETHPQSSSSSTVNSTHLTTVPSSAKSAASATQSDVPTYSPAPPPLNNIVDLTSIMVGMGRLILAARS